jgi:GT2 family glycosyltransferase
VDELDQRLLDIVIVSSDGARPHLRPLLKSLERHPLTRGPMKVWLVDNASSDRTPEMVRTEFPWVHLIALDWNSGFTVANNVALRQCTGAYQLLLNPDTEILDSALDYMVDVMERHPDVGISSCRLVRRDGTFDHAAKRSFPTPLGALAHFTGIGRRPWASPRLAQYRATEIDQFGAGEVDAVNGAFMLVRKEAMDHVGLLDEGYWLYMDDLDWCYRFKQKGWKVFYDGGTTIVHVKGGTTVRQRHRGLRHNVAFHRSMGRFYRKFYAGRNPLVDGVIYLAIGGKLAISITRSTIARRGLR